MRSATNPNSHFTRNGLSMGASSSSESKGAKRGTPYMRGAATSFGFRRPGKNNANVDKLPTTVESSKEYSQDALLTNIKPSTGLPSSKNVGGSGAGRTNRFGFRSTVCTSSNEGGVGRGLSNKVSDSSNQQPLGVLGGLVKKTVTATAPRAIAVPRGPLNVATTKKPVPKSTVSTVPSSRPVSNTLLPRPQFASRPLSKDLKGAKTWANVNTRGVAPIATFDDEIYSSKESSMNGDSGLGSQPTGDTDTLHGIEILDNSPRQAQRSRSLRSINSKSTGLQIVKDEDDDEAQVFTEIVRIPNLVARSSSSLRAGSDERLQYKGSIKSASSDEFHDDEGLGRDYGEGLDDRSEEKVVLDRRLAEKLLHQGGRLMKDYGLDEQADWGPGEAMAEDDWKEELSSVAIDADISAIGNPLDSIQLKVESQNLANLVAASSGHGLIEDESAPEDSIFSNSSSLSDDAPSKIGTPIKKKKIRTKTRDSKDTSQRHESDDFDKTEHPIPSKGAKQDEHLISPDGSGTPSFSMSDGRDFLIDDEITDQPQLTIHSNRLGGDGELLSITESTATLRLGDSSLKQVLDTDSPRLISRRDSLRRGERSPDTLSPCASITSDDLMMDYERSECSALDDAEKQMRSLDSIEISSRDLNNDVLREWTSLVGSFHKEGVPMNTRTRLLRSRAGSANSAPDSPRSMPSPFRPPRQLASSDSDESAMMRLDRGTYQHMFQDVVSIKTMLLKLKRILQEAETLNPFESTLKNGYLHQLALADDLGNEDSRNYENTEEEVVDLKRQMVLMKQQLDEKDRTIHLMQLQMMKYERITDDTEQEVGISDSCNAATQTERVRPTSAGPSLLQTFPPDSNGVPLVSWTDTWGRRSRTPARGSSSSSSSSNGDIKVTSPNSLITTRSSRSSVRYSTSPGESPSNIPLVKGATRKTANFIDAVPNNRKPPPVSLSRKVFSSTPQKS